MQSTQQQTSTRHRSTCEVLLPLFEGPTGAMALGRLLDGTDAGRSVLLREVASSEAVGFALTVRSARRLTHPAIAKTITLAGTRVEMYVASEHVDGVTVFELLGILERAHVGLDAAVAVRIVADALLAAQQIRELFRRRETPRCLFVDTVWITSYGGTLISEPLVAAFARRGSAGAQPQRDPCPNHIAASSDVDAALDLLFRLVLGSARSRLLSLSDTRIPSELLWLMENRERWTTCGSLEKALRSLPSRLVASEGAVAASVEQWFGPTLKLRRHAVNSGRFRRPLDSTEDTGNYGELCLGPKEESIPESTERNVDRSAPAKTCDAVEETKCERRNNRPEPEISTEQLRLDAAFDDTDSDDEQEITQVLRPSRILPPRTEASVPLSSIETSTIVDETVAQSGVDVRTALGKKHKGRLAHALFGLGAIMALITLVWVLSHLLIQM